MKAACLLTNSIYALAISDRGRIGMDVLGSGFADTKETTGGDGIAGAKSMGRDEISNTIDGTETEVSGTIVGTEVVVGTSFGCALPASLVLASDPRACLSPDSVDS